MPQLPFYGWAIAVAAALATFASGPGQSYVFSVVVDPILADTGMSRTSLSLLYACGTAVSAAMTFGVGRLVDHYGARMVLIAVGLSFGIACAGMARITGPLGLLAGFAALRALGQGSLPVIATLLTAQWFVLYRGRAMALVMLGFAASNALLPPMTQALVALRGWREAYFVLGGLVWLLILPAAILIVRDRPEVIGRYPDGASAPPPGEGQDDPALPVLAARLSLRSPAFWLLALPLGASPFLVTALVFHQSSIFAERGLGPDVAAQSFVPFAVASACAMLLGGFLIERFGPKRVIMFNMGLTVVAIGWLLVASSPMAALIYAALFGATAGIQSIAAGVAWAHYYGRRGLGRIQGAAALVMITGAAVAPLPLAALQEAMGGYRPGLLLMLSIPLVCAGLVAAFRPPATEARTDSIVTGERS